jgi:anti-anti-sigma regulatory factor
MDLSMPTAPLPTAPATHTREPNADAAGRPVTWTVRIRPHHQVAWAVVVLGPIDGSSADRLNDMTTWVGAQDSVTQVAIDLWGAEVRPDHGGLAVLAVAIDALANSGVEVFVSGAEPAWQADLARLVCSGRARFD